MIQPVLMYGCETWTFSQKCADMINTFERKILRRIYGPINENGVWRIRNNNELKQLYRTPNLDIIIRLKRLQWAGHVYRMQDQRIPKIKGTGTPHILSRVYCPIS